MPILVTGAGMIGSQIARLLLERGETPILFDVVPQLDNIGSVVDLSRVKIVRGDVLDPLQLIRVINQEKIDRIIHTAVIFGMTGAMEKEPFPGIRLNIMGTANVLESARLTGVKRVVFTSTSAMYLRPFLGPVGESLPEDFPIKVITGRSRSPYATSKLVCEWLGFNYLDNCGIDFVAVRFAGVFGPWKGPLSGVTGYRFRDILTDALAGKSVTLKGEAGWHASDTVYSKDAARGAVLACFAEKPRQRVYNISMGKLYSQGDIAQILKRLFPRVEIREAGEGGGFKGMPHQDLSKSESELGYRPEFLMEAALRDFADWIKQNNS